MTGARVSSHVRKIPGAEGQEVSQVKADLEVGGPHPAQDFQKEFRLGFVDIFQHHHHASGAARAANSFQVAALRASQRS